MKAGAPHDVSELNDGLCFFSPRCSVLSRCCHAVLALLYPFTWQHTFIPVLPASMLDVSCSPTPFLIGVLTPCLPELLELPIEEVSQISCLVVKMYMLYIPPPFFHLNHSTSPYGGFSSNLVAYLPSSIDFTGL